MFYYKKIINNFISVYASTSKPKRFNGLVEITKEEYNALLATILKENEEAEEVM